MPRTFSLVQRVEIASPCPASWAEMSGDDRGRFCAHCKLNVYNLSEMTEEEGERLIIEKEGKLCARIYRRADGTVITRDCPVGLAAIRRKMVGFGLRVAAVLACIVGATAYAIAGERASNRRLPASLRWAMSREQESPYAQAISKLQQWLTATSPPRQTITMGVMMPVQPSTPVQPPPPKSTSNWPSGVRPHELIKGGGE